MIRELKEWGWMAAGFGAAFVLAWLGVTVWTFFATNDTRDRVTEIEQVVFSPKVGRAQALNDALIDTKHHEGVVPSTGNPPQSQPGPPSGGPPGQGGSGTNHPLPQNPSNGPP